MITFFEMLKTKDPPPMFDRKPIQLVSSSRTNQATDGSLGEGNNFESWLWSYPRGNKTLEGSHTPDIHVNPHEVVLGVEVHVWLEALPLAGIVATHTKHRAPDGEVFTNRPDHLFFIYYFLLFGFPKINLTITLSLSSFFSSMTVSLSKKAVGSRALILRSVWKIEQRVWLNNNRCIVVLIIGLSLLMPGQMFV